MLENPKVSPSIRSLFPHVTEITIYIPPILYSYDLLRSSQPHPGVRIVHSPLFESTAVKAESLIHQE